MFFDRIGAKSVHNAMKAPVGPGPRVLIIVQNLPVPFDRRVWLECRTLESAGYRVAVVCPKGPGDPSYTLLDGVELYKYKAFTSRGGKAGFFAEYLYSFLATAWLALKASTKGRFAALQACNPPDIFWPIALLFRLAQGSRFVFDHHDLCPETYKYRFPDGPRSLHRGLLFLERRTMRSADRVISTNDTYHRIAVQRGGVDPRNATVVRTGPDPERLKRLDSGRARCKVRPFTVVYIGVMGPQDGVDLVLEVADVVVNRLGRRDVEFVLIGSGDCYEDLVETANALSLGEFVTFTGRIPDESVAAIMSSADVGISPDPKNFLNEFCTMNKTMEYMAFGLPVVAFDLCETRVSAGDAALYATPNEVDDMAHLLLDLLDDEPRRRTMGTAGRERIEKELAWTHQSARYVAVFDELVGAVGARSHARRAARAQSAAMFGR